MQIKNLFERDIFRSINGVVKADQLDDSSISQELDEFVVTKEMDQHLRRFFSTYLDAIDHKNDPDIAGKIGVWVSGFFGSGKSHFIKVLSYLLRNQQVAVSGQSNKAVGFFESKVKDSIFLGEIKRAVATHTDVILFNIDSKASHKTGRDAILQVFLKVLNEMQGYSPDHPHIAHMERYLDEKGTLKKFKDAFSAATKMDWATERDAYEFNRDEVIDAFSKATGQSKESSSKWIDNAEANFSLTVESFCKWVKEYLDTKGKDHRLLFLVDEVGQFIGTDSHLMLNLQTITEELGVTCKGRAWIVVTSQEDIDAVLGEMKPPKNNDFSKITGRFKTRLSLSSANVDEVIQSRLLAKVPGVKPELEALYAAKGDIIKNQLTFTKIGMTLRAYKDADDFVKNYPFAPYQFQLMQKVFEAIRKAGATGLHLSRGERSILDAFQSAGKAVALQEVGALVPMYRFYPSIESFLDTSVKRTIDQAAENPSLEPFDVRMLQVLFLIRYVEEIKGNVDNLVTLCIDGIDVDRLALRHKIEESLTRLEKETLVSRSGDNYFFLTNEERDINREIKNVDLTGGEEAKLLGEIIFDDVLKGQRKHRYSVNKMDFDFNRMCDQHPVGNQLQSALLVSVVTPLNDDYELYGEAKCKLDSTIEGGILLIRLKQNDTLERELRTYRRTEKYIPTKSDGTQPEQTKKILRNIAEDNRERRTRLTHLLAELFVEAGYFANGQLLSSKATGAANVLDEALEYLIKNTFTKMGLLKRLQTDDQSRLREIQSTLRVSDLAPLQLNLKAEDANGQAVQDIRSYVELCTKTSRQIVLHDLIQSRARRPYGWPELETVLILAHLLMLGDISLVMDGVAISHDRAYEPLTTTSKWRKITVVQRKTADPKSIHDARTLGQKLFAEMGPDGEDALFVFLQGKLEDWQTNLTGWKALADTGEYPGVTQINDGLTLIKPLLADKDSFKFIERFNTLKADLLDLAEDFHDLGHFYKNQRATWDKLRKALLRFELNRLELDRDGKAAPALRRMQEIIDAPAPYPLIHEAEGLILTVDTVNKDLLTHRRTEVTAKIGKHVAALEQELNTAKADADLRKACLSPLEALKQQVAQQQSLAHITQAETEAERAFDTAMAKIAEALKPKTPPPGGGDGKKPPPPTVKPLQVFKPADLAPASYLETEADVEAFLDTLRKALKAAVAENKRIQIR